MGTQYIWVKELIQVKNSSDKRSFIVFIDTCLASSSTTAFL